MHRPLRHAVQCRAGYTKRPARPCLAHPLVLLLELISIDALKPLRIVLNAGNGCAGPVFDAFVAKLTLKVVRLAHQLEGRFPNGIPKPLLPQNRAARSRVGRENGAALGIAWNGDFDRCFFSDERGEFIEGYYLVGLLAKTFLRKYPGENLSMTHALSGIHARLCTVWVVLPSSQNADMLLSRSGCVMKKRYTAEK